MFQYENNSFELCDVCRGLISSCIKVSEVVLVEQIPWASFQGGGLRSTTFVAIYQNVRLDL